MVTKPTLLKNLPGLVNGYRANGKVLQRIRDVTFVALVSPTGMGKTTLLQESGWPLVVTDTTRDIRQGEVAGRDMYFRRDYGHILEQIAKGDFVQIAVGPTGDLYGSRAEAYPEQGIAANAVVADAVPTYRKLGFRAVFSIFITAPDYPEWQRRLHARGDSEQEVRRRLPEARRSLELALADESYTFVLNSDIRQAAKDLHDVVGNIYSPDKDRKARGTALDILHRFPR